MEELIAAAKGGDTGTIAKVLDRGVPVDAADEVELVSFKAANYRRARQIAASCFSSWLCPRAARRPRPPPPRSEQKRVCVMAPPIHAAGCPM